MADVILKGELHTSEQDLNEERELLTEGVDALVLESQAEKASYGLLRGWYATAMAIINIVLFKSLYADHSPLLDIAKAQGAKIVFTRETDAEIIENANLVVEFVSGLVFWVFFIFSIMYGILTGDTLTGAGFLLVSAMFPVLILRVHESYRTSADKNRESIIAQKITDAAEEGGQVVAIVGASHMDDIEEKLPNWIELETRSPKYKVFSKNHAYDLAFPAFTAFSVLFVLYLVILSVMKWSLTLTL